MKQSASLAEDPILCLTKREVGRHLGVSERTVHTLIQEGKLAVRVNGGRLVRIERAELIAFIERQRVKSQKHDSNPASGEQKMKVRQLVDSNTEATIAFTGRTSKPLPEIYFIGQRTLATCSARVWCRLNSVFGLQGYLESKALPLPSSTVDVSSLWAALREHLCFEHESTIEGIQPFFKDFANAARGIGDQLARVYDLDSNAIEKSTTWDKRGLRPDAVRSRLRKQRIRPSLPACSHVRGTDSVLSR